MSDQVLYRKYRSSNFAEIVGQEHIVRTLTSAIAHERFSHAYLFTGPRGTGKTSVARLLARALNCTGDEKPCNKCPNCLAAINSSLDLVEIDAASNRSIDAVRDLREKVVLAPTQGRYKIYIIDEVHMLTTEAFNALLKTLEEPPAHAVFILATTEAHKLPETIISRTQRFSFKPITSTDIVNHLGYIAAQEGITIEPAALEIIAAASRGGFRDAISALDQLRSGGESPITADTVRMLLGYSNSEEITALSQAVAASDPKAALQIVVRMDADGAQPGQIAVQLIEQWRAILLASAGVGQAADDTIRELSAIVPPKRIAHILETLLGVARSHWPQLALEAAIVQLTATDSPEPPADNPAPRRIHSSAPTATRAPKTSPAPRPEPPAETSEAQQSPGDPQLASELWPKALVILKSQNNSLCALLQMYPVDFADGQVTIKPRFNFHRDLFLKPANRNLIEAAASKVYGRPVKINARTEEDGAKARRKRPDPTAELVSSALEILGGEVVD